MKAIQRMVRKVFLGKQRGFTLIEVLVTVGILGLLAAVAVPNVARFAGKGPTEAAKAELQSVQTAIDSAMSDNGLQSVTAQTAVGSATKDFSSAGLATLGNDSQGNPIYLSPNYMRQIKSGGSTITYDWDAAGKVAQAGSWK